MCRLFQQRTLILSDPPLTQSNNKVPYLFNQYYYTGAAEAH